MIIMIMVIVMRTYIYIYILIGFTPCKAEQPLRGMKLQRKEAQKDYSKQEVSSKNLQLKKDVC